MSKFSKQIKKELKEEKKENKNSSKEKNKSTNDEPKTKRSKHPKLKKFILITLVLILSIFIGLLICFFVNKKEITKDVLLTNYSTEVHNENRIIASSVTNIKGKVQGKEYDQDFTTEERLSDDVFYFKQNNESLFYDYDFAEYYVTPEWLYVKKKGNDKWDKFTAKSFFGDKSLYSLFDLYYSVSIFGETELEEDENYYYLEQNISLQQFLKFVGESEGTISDILASASKNDPNISEKLMVKNVYKFDRKNYSLKSARFSFVEPLKADDDNYISIDLLMEYSTGVSSDFAVPNNVKEATELDANETFHLEELKKELEEKNKDSSSSVESSSTTDSTTESSSTDSSSNDSSSSTATSSSASNEDSSVETSSSTDSNNETLTSSSNTESSSNS